MQVLFGLVCVLAVVSARLDAGEQPLHYSQRLRDIAKYVNSRDDVTWVAYDPEMTEEEYEARRLVIENRIVTLGLDGARNKYFDVLDSKHGPGFSVNAGYAPTKDYSKHPNLRKVEDQGSCGSCWAFSTVHAFNDYVNIVQGVKKVPDLSIQEVLTCCSGEGCGGCNGGYLVASYNYMNRYGTVPASCKGYNQNPGRCSSSCDYPGGPESSQTHYFPNAYHPFSGSGMTPIMQALQTGPASGSLMVYEDLMTYKSGVYYHTRGALQGGHAIEIVGYGGSGSGSYWIVKNSWGPRWGGMGGFFWIRSGYNDCNFESMERGYNTGNGFGTRSVIANPPQPKLQSVDYTPEDYPADETDPAGDEVEDADTNDALVLEAGNFAATQLNPTHCDGNVTLYRIISAQQQLVSGVNYFMNIAVDADSCERGPEVFFVEVYMHADLQTFDMVNSYGQGALNGFQGEGCEAAEMAAAAGKVDSMWKTLAGVFIGISAAVLVLSIVLAVRLMRSPRAAPSTEGGSSNYHPLNAAEHDL